MRWQVRDPVLVNCTVARRMSPVGGNRKLSASCAGVHCALGPPAAGAVPSPADADADADADVDGAAGGRLLAALLSVAPVAASADVLDAVDAKVTGPAG